MLKVEQRLRRTYMTTRSG